MNRLVANHWHCLTAVHLSFGGAFALPSAVAQVLDYRLHDLGYLGNEPAEYNFANAINDQGTIVGSCSLAYGEYVFDHATRWSNGLLEDLADLSADTFFEYAIGISEAGFISGFGVCNCDCDPCLDHYFVTWDQGELSILPVAEGCSNNQSPYALSSNANFLSGTCYSGLPLLGTWATVIDLGFNAAYLIEPPDGYSQDRNAYAWAVSDFGLVAGYYMSEGTSDVFETTRGFTWINGIMNFLPELLGDGMVKPYSINNLGTVAGVTVFQAGGNAAFFYFADGRMIDVGDGTVWAINDRNIGVGEDIENLELKTRLYTEFGSIDLTPQFPGGFHAGYPEDINNYGWIVGWSFHDDGFVHSWLMVPIYSKGDYDGDEDVDLQDFGKFQECFAAEPYQGPEGGLHIGCSVFDFDDDIDLDLTDYAALQTALTGPTAPDLNPTGPG